MSDYTLLEELKQVKARLAALETQSSPGRNPYLDTITTPTTNLDISSTGANSQTAIEVGMRATGNRFAVFDLHGDDTYLDYSARFIRTNTGPNADTMIVHRGTGVFLNQLLEAGTWNVAIQGVNRLSATNRTNVWQTPTLLNSWVNFGGSYNTAAYSIDACGIVHLRGIVKSGVMGAPIFTLPVGYRPAGTSGPWTFPVISNSLFGQCGVYYDGGIAVLAGSNVSFSLDGISFPTF